MTDSKRSEYVTRDHVLTLLSDAEVASVSMAETAGTLVNGDEYLDLERLDHGVLHAGVTTARMGRVLPRKAVHGDTWAKILLALPAAVTH